MFSSNLYSLTYEKSNEEWVLYHATDVESANFKLHLAIDIHQYEKIIPDVVKILEHAAKKVVISGFKYRPYKVQQLSLLQRLNYDIAALKIHPGYKAASEDQQKKYVLNRTRLYHNPITIYLPKQKCNFLALAKVCQTLERLVSEQNATANMPFINEHLTFADLPVLPHITLRQVSLSNDYLCPTDATESELYELVKGGKSSHYYQLLNKNLEMNMTEHLVLQTIIFKLLEFDNYTVHGGFNVEINGKVYTRMAYKCLETIENYYDNEINDEKYLPLLLTLEQKFEKKTKPSNGLFGMGARDSTTVELYKDVLKLIQDEIINSKSIERNANVNPS